MCFLEIESRAWSFPVFSIRTRWVSNPLNSNKKLKEFMSTTRAHRICFKIHKIITFSTFQSMAPSNTHFRSNGVFLHCPRPKETTFLITSLSIGTPSPSMRSWKHTMNRWWSLDSNYPETAASDLVPRFPTHCQQHLVSHHGWFGLPQNTEFET